MHGGVYKVPTADVCEPINENQPTIEDPLKDVAPPPACTFLNDKVTVPFGATMTLNPGCYPEIVVYGTARFNPGIFTVGKFMIQNGSIAQSVSQDGLIGNMFYITNTGGIDGEFRVSGNTNVDFLPMDPGVYPAYERYSKEGIVVFQDRNNTKELIIEDADAFETGTIYAIGTTIKIQDNTATTVVGENLRFISDKFDMQGLNTLTFSPSGTGGAVSVKLVQ